MTVTWHGTGVEGKELLAAFEHNCGCSYSASDPAVRTATCPAHKALVNDQRMLDGLLFIRRIAPRLRDKEGEGEPTWLISTI